jgi:DNA-binding MarR family transcriptional regulator
MDATREELSSLLSVIVRFLREANRAAAATPDQSRIAVLNLLEGGGEISSLAIAARLDLRPSSVVRELRTLEESQLVTVTEDHGPDGCLVASATPAACEELRQIRAAACDMLAAVIQRWSAEDVRDLAAHMTRLTDDWVAFLEASAQKVQPPEQVHRVVGGSSPTSGPGLAEP